MINFLTIFIPSHILSLNQTLNPSLNIPDLRLKPNHTTKYFRHQSIVIQSLPKLHNPHNNCIQNIIPFNFYIFRNFLRLNRTFLNTGRRHHHNLKIFTAKLLIKNQKRIILNFFSRTGFQ